MNYTLTLTNPWAFLAAFLPLSLWAVYAYTRNLPPQTPARRWTLTALRIAASLLLGLMLGGLRLAGEGREAVKPRLHVLLDASASMARADGGGDETRYDRARALLAEARDRWGERLTIETRPFGASPRRADPPAEAVEPATDMAAALKSLPHARERDRVLLLSDGRDTEGRLWGGDIDAGPPIIAVLTGDSLPPPDLRIESLEMPPVVHKGGRLPLTVDIVAQGGAARAGRLTVREGDTILHEREWALPPGARRIRLETPLVMEETGRRYLEIEVSGDGPDAAPANNRRLAALRVVEGELRILVLAGLPDWDLSALMHGLRGEPFLDLCLVTAGEGGAPRRADTGEPWDPDAEEYHGLLLHSLHPNWEPALAERVRVRGGTLALGPFLAASGRAAWLADWRLAPPGRARERRECPLELGSDAYRHAALRGVVAAGLKAADLPPLEAGFASPLSGGRELLRGDGLTLLATAEMGGRRLALFSGLGFWRWGLRDGDGGLFTAELFSGLLRWLGREDPPHRLVLDWGGASVQAGLPSRLTAELFDADFEPSAGARLEWSVRRGGELVAVGEFAPTGTAGQYRADLPVLPEGVFDLEARAVDAEGEALTRAVELPVVPPDRELLYPAADAATMRWLAARSGGLFLDASEGLDPIAERIDFEPAYVTRAADLKLWQHPLLFLLLLALLGTEWGLRKRFGMI